MQYIVCNRTVQKHWYSQSGCVLLYMHCMENSQSNYRWPGLTCTCTGTCTMNRSSTIVYVYLLRTRSSGSLIHRSPVTYMTCGLTGDCPYYTFTVECNLIVSTSASALFDCRQCIAHHWKALSHSIPTVYGTYSTNC